MDTFYFMGTLFHEGLNDLSNESLQKHKIKKIIVLYKLCSKLLSISLRFIFLLIAKYLATIILRM